MALKSHFSYQSIISYTPMQCTSIYTTYSYGITFSLSLSVQFQMLFMPVNGTKMANNFHLTCRFYVCLFACLLRFVLDVAVFSTLCFARSKSIINLRPKRCICVCGGCWFGRYFNFRFIFIRQFSPDKLSMKGNQRSKLIVLYCNRTTNWQPYTHRPFVD